ncbi:MAG: hypothetical protein LQ346_001876 [Caloplaca aetnensis]|nr:MAG: hypothetical protein LQ346_001876 [Caloplaca aetnensis]
MPSDALLCSHLKQEALDFQRFVTLALGVAAAEYTNDPKKADKIRNVSRGLRRFRVKRESKGVHGHSFRGAFTGFEEVGEEDYLITPPKRMYRRALEALGPAIRLSDSLSAVWDIFTRVSSLRLLLSQQEDMLSCIHFAATLQVRIARVDSIGPGTASRLKRLSDCLQGTELSYIQAHLIDWTRIEQKLKAENLTVSDVSDELADCLGALWEDALHLFCNLEAQKAGGTKRPALKQKFQQLWNLWVHATTQAHGIADLIRYIKSEADGLGIHEFPRLVLATPLVAPRKEGETFQDLEQDLRAHLVQLEIERYDLDSNTSFSKKSDFLEDVESTPENTVRICLLHAFLQAAPFRSGGEATATIQDYTRKMSHMAWSARNHPSKALLHQISQTCEELKIIKCIIIRQQKAHSRIVQTIDQILEIKHGGKPNHQRSQGSKDPAKAPPRMHTPLSAWLRTQKILEDVEQLEGEGKRLAEQTIQLVDIKVEDQAKAVMVFTIVTVIFLPLSFVSSYFGMNTADIRNTEQGQWIFWAVGASVTFAVAALALLAAFRGQRWRRKWNEKFDGDYERGLKME